MRFNAPVHLVPRQILIVFAIVLATLWAATQRTAWWLGFEPQLGPPWHFVKPHP